MNRIREQVTNDSIPSVPGTLLYGFLIGVGLALSYFVIDKVKVKVNEKRRV